MEKQMLVMVVRVDLLEESGRRYFPIEDPIPWDIEINSKSTEILAGCPNVVGIDDKGHPDRRSDASRRSMSHG